MTKVEELKAVYWAAWKAAADAAAAAWDALDTRNRTYCAVAVAAGAAYDAAQDVAYEAADAAAHAAWAIYDAACGVCDDAREAYEAELKKQENSND
jgi:hypothetical protein